MRDIEALFRKCAAKTGDEAKKEGEETPERHIPVVEEKRIGPGMIRRRLVPPVIKNN